MRSRYSTLDIDQGLVQNTEVRIGLARQLQVGTEQVCS